jgi:hypothetical protein
MSLVIFPVISAIIGLTDVTTVFYLVVCPAVHPGITPVVYSLVCPIVVSLRECAGGYQ